MSTFTRRLMLSTTAAGISLPVFAARAQDAVPGPSKTDTNWLNYAHDLANTRYAPLDQINSTNFSSLEVAWRFRTDALGPHPEYQYEATPLVVDGKLYSTAGARRDVVCLDAASGEMIWMHSENEGARGRNAPRQLSGRGVAYWNDGAAGRILYVTPGYRLIALDARTGVPVQDFGDVGVVDLKLDDDQSIDPTTGEVGLHATPLVAGNVVIVGAAHLSGSVPHRRTNVKGYVRGFDVRTGKRIWIFHTIPRKGEFGYDTWLHPGDIELAGNAGCWGQISADLELGLAYLPIELPSGDEVGIYRAGPGLFGESIVAVDIQTGQRRWHYQTVHHGLWDRDIPCAPILCDIPHNGRIVKALAQPTKQCFLYVLDRETGKPIWPIPERPQPAGDVPGEWYSPTQPIPTQPPAYDVQTIDADTIINFTPELHAKGLEIVSHYRTGGIYTPPTLSTQAGSWGSLVALTTQGGTNWPGGCYDPEMHMVYVFSQTTVGAMGVVPVVDKNISEFAFVHGMASSAPVPSVAMGSARPPATSETPGGNGSGGLHPGRLTVDGLPLMKPPYGRITAIDLSKGTIAWQVAHGETPDAIRNHPALKGLHIPRTGRSGLLGPTVTKSLVICGEAGFFTTPSGVPGAMLRAYDKITGEEKGAVYMPAPQTGSPMTYMLAGEQYIVLAIGGINHPAELIAFRLPSRSLG
jgi:quinoprotein glucose dehydrogenase